MQQCITTQRQKYQFSKYSLIPFIDCLFLLLIFLFFVENAPIKAIPVDISHTHGHGVRGHRYYVTVTIDTSPLNRNEGTMRFYEGSHNRVWIAPRGNLSKADMEKRYRDYQKLHIPVKYDDILSRLMNLPEERKKVMVIRSDREVFHEQIIRVLEIAAAGGVDRFEFEVTQIE